MPLDISPEFTTAIEYNTDGTEKYVGESTPGTSQTSNGWRIRLLTYDGSQRVIKVEWASGSNELDKIWSSRGTYVYS